MPLQHHQGQVTAGRITGCLNGLGLVISERQGVRLLTAGSAALVAEAAAVPRAGLETARWPTADDTGARQRAAIGPPTGRRRAADGPPTGRRRGDDPDRR